MQILSSSREFVEEEFTLRVGTKMIILAMSMGVVNMNFGIIYLFLNYIYYIPCFRRNLLSVGDYVNNFMMFLLIINLLLFL